MVPGASPAVSVSVAVKVKCFILCSFYQILVKGKKDTRACHILKSGLKTLAQGLARHSHLTIARQALKDQKIRSILLRLLVTDLQSELKKMCTLKSNSCLRQRSITALSSFTWDKLLSEMASVAPTVLQILQGCATVKRRKRLAKKGIRKGKMPKSSARKDSAVVGMCTAILLRHRSQRMNLVQRLLSVILHSGHASKEVNVNIIGI